jgi:double stranded RNA-specific editase B
MQVKIDDKCFFACGSSKKLAKHRCAQVALENLFNLKFQSSSEREVDHEKFKDFKKFADSIDEVVKVAIENVKTQLDSDILKQHYVYAAIVQTNNNEINDKTKLICLTTGTKCINGEYMSQNGMSVNDCHAEILAIRVLRRYLYEQLEVFVNHLSEKQFKIDQNEQNEFLFNFEHDLNTNTCKFNLKDFVKFHLYISTTPCGDGIIILRSL